ncbi:MAG: hypothetical protein LIO53_07305, partial [Oscillospiraceae bacterium]|nr:hypothetical protein [Oscillospiraceae bacterium]
AYQNKIFKHSDLNYVKLLQLQAEKDKNPPLYIYEAIGFSYWSPMAHALPEDIKNNMDLILYSNHASQQNLYISIFHRPQDNALEFCFEYLMNEKPEEDLKRPIRGYEKVNAYGNIGRKYYARKNIG